MIVVKNKNAGFSLIEALVGISVMSLMSFAMMSSIQTMQKEQRALNEKIETLELDKILSNKMTDGVLCTYVLADPAWAGFRNTNIFDSSNSAATIQLTKIPMAVSTPTNLLAQVGQKLTSISSQLSIQKIEISKFSPLGSGRYSADVSLYFSNSVRAMKPAVQYIELQTSGAGVNKTITSCNSVASTAAVTSGTGYDGQSGTLACASVGKKCAYVQSDNYIQVDASCPGATHCIHICSTSYNRSLPGVLNGTDMPSFHSCNAKVGNYCTYLHPGVVQCNATFSAVCTD